MAHPLAGGETSHSVSAGWRLELEPDTVVSPTVEWANKLIDEYGEPGPLEFDNDDIHLRMHHDVAHRRYDASEPAVYYPALAVPLGEEDELVCPSSHIQIARDRLVGEDGLNLLVVGYSGADLEVLRLLAESGNWIKRLLVVNGSPDAAVAAARLIADAFQKNDVRTEWVSASGSTDLVASGELRRWMTEVAESS